MKKLLLSILRGLFGVLSYLPFSARLNLISELVNGSIGRGNVKENLRLLLELDNRLYSLQGKNAREAGQGIHSKHEYLKYYEFFAGHLTSGQKVFDVGSGVGYMDCKLMELVPGIKLTGIELSRENYEYALCHHSHPDLHFINGDVYHHLPDDIFDVVTLSNVLEHFEDRVGLLRLLQRQLKPSKFIIRVPSFERDWRVPLKKELGVDYRLDSTHFIEYTREDFQREMSAAGLRITHLEMRWGEIWSVLEPVTQDRP